MVMEAAGRLQPPAAPMKEGGIGAQLGAKVFISLGALLLMLPVWNAIALMTDANYVFWIGRKVAVWLLETCVIIFIVYIITVLTFFRKSSASRHSYANISLLGSVFVMLLGLALLLISLPLQRDAMDAYNDLMYSCESSDMTHRMFEYSQVLYNIRQSPECQELYSVEECAGYAEAPPYTNFLKAMESDFQCAGFCYRAVPFVAAAPGPAPGPAPAAFVEVRKEPRRLSSRSKTGQVALLSTRIESSEMHSEHHSASAHDPDPTVEAVMPPMKLFSDGKADQSCEGMAARDLKMFAGDVGAQTYYQGIYLILAGLLMGFAKLISICLQGDSI
jgi:hypothetical protein